MKEKLKDLEKKFGYNKVYIFFLFLIVLSTILYLLGGAKLVTDLVSFVYPAYMSFKAIDSGNVTVDTQWLTYWVVFAFISIFEGACGFLINWIPMYFFGKVAFFVWLYHPSFLGAGVIYTSILRPVIIPYLNAAQEPAQKKKE